MCFFTFRYDFELRLSGSKKFFSTFSEKVPGACLYVSCFCLFFRMLRCFILPRINSDKITIIDTFGLFHFQLLTPMVTRNFLLFLAKLSLKAFLSISFQEHAKFQIN